MKFTIQLLIIVILGYVGELFLPWWAIAIAAFAGGALFNTRANFAAGFLGIALLWVIRSFIIDYAAAAPLADRVATIFTLTKPLLFVVTGLIGGLVGGFAAMAGGALHRKKKTGYYKG